MSDGLLLQRLRQNPLPATVDPDYFNPPGSEWMPDEHRALVAAFDVLIHVEKQLLVFHPVFTLVQTQLHVWYPLTWKRTILELEERIGTTERVSGSIASV